MTDQPYFDAPGINATAIKAGRQSMRLMHHVLTTTGKPATPAMRWGTLIHAAVLEPETVGTWAVWDGPNWRGKGVAEWKTENADRTQVLAHEQADLLKIVASVHSNKHAAAMIGATDHEVWLDWTTDDHGKCKAKVDGVGPGILFDLKTTRGDLDDRTLAALSYRMGYHIQMGWYMRGAQACGYKVTERDVHIIWLRQGDDLDCRVMQMAPGLVSKGAEEAYEIAHRYRVHEACGTFPGVSDGVDVLEAPRWAQDDEDSETTATETMEASEL